MGIKEQVRKLEEDICIIHFWYQKTLNWIRKLRGRPKILADTSSSSNKINKWDISTWKDVPQGRSLEK